VVRPLLRDELGFDGVIFTDDLDMKAVAAKYPAPLAVVEAIAAGCDGVLICNSGIDTQVAALEAIIHAVEDERLPYARIEDALARHRRMKERFLLSGAASTRHADRLPARPLRTTIGADAHAAIAEEMSKYL
jgi:beta-N-acetylhexosaminidase